MLTYRLQSMELLRTAYYRAFNKDITTDALKQDTDAYNNHGKIPKYLTAYMLYVYGTK